LNRFIIIVLEKRKSGTNETLHGGNMRDGRGGTDVIRAFARDGAI
jgi:hypothetical protein